MITVSGGTFTKVLMILVGVLFMVASFAAFLTYMHIMHIITI
jgi:hypothetical protein